MSSEVETSSPSFRLDKTMRDSSTSLGMTDLFNRAKPAHKCFACSEASRPRSVGAPDKTRQSAVATAEAI